MDRKRLSCILRCWISVLLFYLCREVHGLKVLDVSILSESNHTYVFREEKATITCNFQHDNKAEELLSVQWYIKTGDEYEKFYTWRKSPRHFEVSGVFKGRVNTKTRDPHKLLITSANIEMHGDIKCEVKTSNSQDSKEAKLVIIADTCAEDNWTFQLDKETCMESVNFMCKGFYPKPSVNCGLYDRIKQRYIESVQMKPSKQGDNTYDLSVARPFKAAAYVENDDVVLRCDVIVYGADYKFGIEREMFGERGCPIDYEKINLQVNTTSVTETCWKHPANESVITYQCDNSDSTKTIICLNGVWIDESDTVISDKYCSGSSGMYEMLLSFPVLLFGALIFCMW